VVRGYVTYERTVQEGLAGQRTELPDATRLATAGDAEIAARAQAGGLVALAESYPDLRANEQFGVLASRITTSEDRVAAARRFYNDAVAVLRDRRQVFPYVLVAALVTCPTFDLFEAEASERVVPAPPGPAVR